MDTGIISRRYARTLFLYAREHGVVERVYGESNALSAHLAQSEQLRRVLSNRLLAAEKKYDLAKMAAGGEVSEEFSRFLRLVISQDRVEFLLTILWSFQEMARAEMKLVEVTVTAAADMDESLREEFSGFVEKLIDAKVDLRVKSDPSLVGGYVLRWDTYRLDSSVRGRLARVRAALTEK